MTVLVLIFQNNYLYFFQNGQSSRLMYHANGVSTDWVYHKGITHVYILELPDDGYYGFLTPVDQILPICKNTWNAFRCFFYEFFVNYSKRECKLSKSS